ncbi:MAG: TIGR04452 family lipoprotein [Spirochaetia bacterium]|nr:TIGR04452 family lipoprotein [Spirochaetia bacterium]
MKKVFFTSILSVSILASGSSCILFNVLGLNPGHEKGSVAASRIQSEAILIDIIRVSAISTVIGVPFSSPLVLSLLADKLANIDPDAYYKTREIDECINAMWTIVGLTFGTAYVIKVNEACEIDADNAILDP